MIGLETYEKRSNWLLDINKKWNQIKDDIDDLIELCALLVLKDKEVF